MPKSATASREGEGTVKEESRAAAAGATAAGSQAVEMTQTEEQGLTQNRALLKSLGMTEGADTFREEEAQDPVERERVRNQEARHDAVAWHTFGFEVAKTVLHMFDREEALRLQGVYEYHLQEGSPGSDLDQCWSALQEVPGNSMFWHEVRRYWAVENTRPLEVPPTARQTLNCTKISE